jgi:hypothetical protein
MKEFKKPNILDLSGKTKTQIIREVVLEPRSFKVELLKTFAVILIVTAVTWTFTQANEIIDEIMNDDVVESVENYSIIGQISEIDEQYVTLINADTSDGEKGVTKKIYAGSAGKIEDSEYNRADLSNLVVGETVIFQGKIINSKEVVVERVILLGVVENLPEQEIATSTATTATSTATSTATTTDEVATSTPESSSATSTSTSTDEASGSEDSSEETETESATSTSTTTSETETASSTPESQEAESETSTSTSTTTESNPEENETQEEETSTTTPASQESQETEELEDENTSTSTSSESEEQQEESSQESPEEDLEPEPEPESESENDNSTEDQSEPLDPESTP